VLVFVDALLRSPHRNVPSGWRGRAADRDDEWLVARRNIGRQVNIHLVHARVLRHADIQNVGGIQSNAAEGNREWRRDLSLRIFGSSSGPNDGLVSPNPVA